MVTYGDSGLSIQQENEPPGLGDWVRETWTLRVGTGLGFLAEFWSRLKNGAMA